MFLSIRQLQVKNTVDVNVFEELAPRSSDEGDSNDNENSKISSEILTKVDALGENATDEERNEDNTEEEEKDEEEKTKVDEENNVTPGSVAFTAECQPSSFLEETELSLSDKTQQFGSHKKRKEEIVSTLDVPLVAIGRVSKRKPLPTPPNQKQDEAVEKGLTSAANEGSADVKITIQHQDEPPGDDDDDSISPKDILCFAWQIAQGMVSEQL